MDTAILCLAKRGKPEKTEGHSTDMREILMPQIDKTARILSKDTQKTSDPAKFPLFCVFSSEIADSNVRKMRV